MNTLQPVLTFFESHNWCQFNYHDSGTDSYCVAGAIIAVSRADAVISDRLWNQLRHRISKMHLLPFEWNDAPGRTFEDVIEMLKREDV